MKLKIFFVAACALWVFGASLPLMADDADIDISTIKPDPKLGFDILMNVPMADPVVKIKDLDRLWMVWEPEERAKAEKAKPEERHKMTFSRYGFIEREFDKTGLPLGYTDDHKGNLVTNCFSCHGGKVAGNPYPGLGNSHHDITALITDVARLAAMDRGEDFSAIDNLKATFNTPYNMAKGVSNATMFAFILGALRDANLDLVERPVDPSGLLKHNDLIAPPWWHYKNKEKIYCDAFGSKNHRTIMPFTMSPGNTGEMIRSWEGNFVHIKAYIESVQPPKYPYAVDTKLASKGRELFEMTCARCHGTYVSPDGKGEHKYPNKVIPINEIGTDRVRFDALPPIALAGGNRLWFSNYGKDPINPQKTGYIAQPLDGIWAKAPYFHNGSVPTIAGVFNPSQRPKIWKRDENGYDQKNLGLVYESADAVPDGLSSTQRRAWYDTTASSHGNGGHLFPDQELNADEKIAVMEYLKTL
ncbi:cytochrome c [Candidatus Sumerlaeota bacterium]|nr:cytochrome c [Candidatus Sumerlaeota bacterium]